MRAIVTGATGMVGSAIVNELLECGHSVQAIVRHNSKNIANLVKHENLKIIECELSSLKSVNLPCCDWFFHIAWEGVYGKERDSGKVQKSNIDHTFSAIDLAKNSGCKRFIFASSQAEVGAKTQAISCDTIASPTMLYGVAKLACNTLGKAYAQSIGLEYLSGRILSIYGKNDTKTTLISTLIDKLGKDEKVSVSDCKQIWDYINVKDAARAFVAIAKDGINGKNYPIGSGEGRPLREYVEIIRKVAGKGEVLYGSPVPKGAVTFLQADLSGLTKDTGFRPSISFEEGIKELFRGE